MQVDTTASAGSGIPTTLTLSGVVATFSYVDANGTAQTGRIVAVNWYRAPAANGSVARVACEGPLPPPPPPP